MRTLLILSVYLYLSMTGHSDTIYVPGVNGPTIQAAIDVASPGDVILVAPGTYQENIVFSGNFNIKVKSTGGWANTVIDGMNIANKSVVIFKPRQIDAINKNTVLKGFTITNGRGVDLGSAGVACGGGILIQNCSPKISHCYISDNHCYGSGLPSDQNQGGGGGIACDNSDSIIVNCIIADNTVDGKGGGLGCGRNGEPTDSDITLLNCTFVNNLSEGDGGALYIDQSTVTARNCIFWINTTLMGHQISLNPAEIDVDYCFLLNGENSIYGGEEPNDSVIVYGDHNIAGDLDPLYPPFFVDDNLLGDYHLTFGSPCIDVGNNNLPYMPNKDIDGEPRILNENGVDGTGYLPYPPPDPYPTVDMGADEYYNIE